MKLFKYMQRYGHEQLAFWDDERVGLKAIIAIHDTTLGPALGGARMWHYKTEVEAIIDALRLAEGMTYKAAVAGLNLGGGKAVILGKSTEVNREAFFRSFGRFVDSLNGRYISAEDVGTTVKDLSYVRKETHYVTGLSTAQGGSGDPSPVTAFGVYQGIKACSREVFGCDSLRGRTVAIQGLGKVGYALAEYLHKEEVEIIGTDVNSAAVTRARNELGLEAVDPERIYDIECDIFAPCALGAILNENTIPRLRCSIVAGSANNQLASPRHGDALQRQGILYAPDYVINAGGLISVATELGFYDATEAWHKTTAIYDTVSRVIKLAQSEKIATHVAAQRLAKNRIEAHKSDRIQVVPNGSAPLVKLAA